MNKRRSVLISYFHELITEQISVCFDNCVWDRAVGGAVRWDAVLLSSLTQLLWCMGRHKPNAALTGPIAVLASGFYSWKRSEGQLLAAEWDTKPSEKSLVTCRALFSLLSVTSRDLLASLELQ